MKQTALFFGLFLYIVSAYAGGAASLVSQKSKTRDYSFSAKTRANFMQDCSQNANEQICGCVLDKLQQQYSEKTYLKIDSDLRKNINHPEFDIFASKAVDDCDAEYVKNGEDFFSEETKYDIKVSEEDAKKFVDLMLKERPKKVFVPDCASEAQKLYGEKMAKKVCGCAYDHMANDIPRFTRMVMESGYPENSETWGYEYMVECAPDKFTPEIEKNLVNYLNENGLPKSISQCFVDVLKKEYSVKAYILASITNKDAVSLMLRGLTSKCVADINGGNRRTYNQEVENILEEIASLEMNEYNSQYEMNDNTKSRSSYPGDGLADLLGGAGGIATKAKGSIRTPSERDIEIGAGSSRSAADIMKVVRQRTPGLRHVYNKFLKKKPGFQGKVALKFTIAPEGEIISISIASSTTGYGEFDNEIKTAVSRWKFNKVKSGNTTITVPFTFSE